jgi:hypothetical protein
LQEVHLAAALASTVLARRKGALKKSKIIISVDGKPSFSYLPPNLSPSTGFRGWQWINDCSEAASATQAMLAGDVCSVV